MKYETPDLDTLTLAKLRTPMIEKLEELIDVSMLNETDKLRWDEIVKQKNYEVDTDSEPDLDATDTDIDKCSDFETDEESETGNICVEAQIED